MLVPLDIKINYRIRRENNIVKLLPTEQTPEEQPKYTGGKLFGEVDHGLENLLLRDDGQLRGLEKHLMGIGLRRAVQTVQDEGTEERKADLATHGELPFAFVIDEKHLVSVLAAGDVDVLSHFDIPVGA
jgi:hypothetical protein